MSTNLIFNYIPIATAPECMWTKAAMIKQKQFVVIFFILLLCFCPRVVATRPALQKIATNRVIRNEGHQPVSILSRRERVRPGPKAKPMRNRVYKLRGPIRRIRRSYSRERKIEVLLFLLNHRVAANEAEAEYRRPTFAEASAYWKIPLSTIHEWWEKQEEILQQKTNSHRQSSSTWQCYWPEMEEELFSAFIKRRQAGGLVRRGWFRRTAIELFKKLYPESANMFVFSGGWFNNFLNRWNISCRAITKKASKLPDEYRQLVINWLRFNRRNSQPRNSFERDGITTDVGCFRLSNILNLDETPIPFEYLDGKTYEMKGSRTVSGKTDGGGWDKRQATLILYIFADGIPRIKPKVIFHAKTGEGIIQREGHKWNKGVSVLFNETAYNNESLFKAFITEDLLPALDNPTPRHTEIYSTNTSGIPESSISPPVLPSSSSRPRRVQPCSVQSSSVQSNPIQSNPILPDSRDLKTPRSLLVMDTASFHVTEGILNLLRANNIVPSIIPAGCTGLLQPLDTAVNKPFKEYLREFTDAYIEEREKVEDVGRWSVSDKRIMTTHVVAQSWHAFCQQKSELICKSFRDVGIALPVNGSRDDEIKIKGFTSTDIEIGDWSSNLPVSIAHHPGQEFRALPQETSNHDNLHYVWTCEGYQFQPHLRGPPSPPLHGGDIINFDATGPDT